MNGDADRLKYQRFRAIAVTVGLAIFGFNMVIGGDEPRIGLTGTGLVLSVVTLGCVGAFGVGVYFGRRSSPAALAGYFASAAAAIGLYLLAPDRSSQIMLYLIIAAAATLSPIRESTVVMTVAAGGYVAAVLGTGQNIDQLWSAVGMVGMFVAVIAGRNRKATRRIEQENLVLAERARIAREIHDILAHSLSAQLVHLEGARLLARAGRVDESADRIERARELARGGLTETRRALDTLRGETLDVNEALRELAAEHREASGRGCEVSLVGRYRQVAADAGLALVRTAQEALTNVRKHAVGADVDIELNYLDTQCELRVSDTGGDGGPLTASGSGYGLVGMRERAELIGGTLEAGPAKEGFTVVLRVPS
ncbi:MAG: sensor histidine kinase [Stackebrandtia sp.]